MKAQFSAIADHALLVTFAQELSDAAHAHVIALDMALVTNVPVGVIETVPALVNLLVSFDPMATDHLTVQKHVGACLEELKLQEIAGGRRVSKCVTSRRLHPIWTPSPLPLASHERQ